MPPKEKARDYFVAPSSFFFFDKSFPFVRRGTIVIDGGFASDFSIYFDAEIAQNDRGSNNDCANLYSTHKELFGDAFLLLFLLVVEIKPNDKESNNRKNDANRPNVIDHKIESARS